MYRRCSMQAGLTGSFVDRLSGFAQFSPLANPYPELRKAAIIPRDRSLSAPGCLSHHCACWTRNTLGKTGLKAPPPHPGHGPVSVVRFGQLYETRPRRLCELRSEQSHQKNPLNCCNPVNRAFQGAISHYAESRSRGTHGLHASCDNRCR